MFEYKDIENFKESCGYMIDGVWYPRVTKIVSIKAKPALYKYYADQPSFSAAETAKELSAKEGTLIHEAVEKLLLGQTPEVDETISPAISAFLDFFSVNKIKTSPDFVERKVVSYDHRYAGTVDAIASINGKYGVLDIKTSQSVYRDYNLQTSAYMDPLKNQFPSLETRWILRIDQKQKCARCGATRRTKGGVEKIKNRGTLSCSDQHEWAEPKGEVELQESPYWQHDFQAFLGAKRLWEWENIFWLKKVNYL